MFNYLRYVLFKETRINETLKRHICNKLSKIVADNYTGTAFPENKIDPIVAPLSNKEKICVDCILLKKTKSLELPYPSIKIRIKEYIKDGGRINYTYYDSIYKAKRTNYIWAKWYVRDNLHVPATEARFDEFMQIILSCDEWSKDGLISFYYNQTTLNEEMRKILAELEHKNSPLAFCMFLSLKRQNINSLDLKDIAKWYETSFDILHSDLTLQDVQFFGYKEKHAHTTFDIFGGKDKFSHLRKNSKFIYGEPTSVSKIEVDDVYEQALINQMSEKKMTTIHKHLNSELYRKAAIASADITSFLRSVV
tara:strand:+ start:1631 stop:2554 length:924 start_codon:yes stop_codon:yes gene_type:complete